MVCEICGKNWCFHLMSNTQRKAMFARKRKVIEIETYKISKSKSENNNKLTYVDAYERFIQNDNKIIIGLWSLPPQHIAYKKFKLQVKNQIQDNNAQVS